MKRRQVLTGFKKHQSEERRAAIERDWKYLPLHQQIRFALLILWHASPTIIEYIDHVSETYTNWLIYHIYSAHWVK